MPRDLDALATQVVLTIKAALAPVLADVAALKDKVGAVDTLRDRIVVVETKGGQPVPAVPEPVDLTPILERVAAAEAQLKMLGDVRDRVVAVETKALQPVFTLPPEAGIDDLRDRLKALETRAEGPSPTDMALVDLRERFTNLDRRVGDDTLAKELGALRERVAVVETKGVMPGPAGKDGKDGADGLSFDDLIVDHDGERGFTIKYARGERVKELGTFTLPAMIYRGVYTDGRTYEPGDAVTWGGSMFHCRKTTVLRPDAVAAEAKGANGSDFWTLVVKQGREGKAGRDGRDAAPLPVVSVGGRS